MNTNDGNKFTLTNSKTFSCRAECREDLQNVVNELNNNKAGLVLVKSNDMYFQPSNPSGEVIAEFYFELPFNYKQFLDLISETEDAHVIYQTLLPVQMSENNMERDYDRE